MIDNITTMWGNKTLEQSQADGDITIYNLDSTPKPATLPTITMSDTYIYELEFGDGKLVYVGKSKKPYFRYQQHLKKMTNG